MWSSVRWTARRETQREICSRSICMSLIIWYLWRLWVGSSKLVVHFHSPFSPAECCSGYTMITRHPVNEDPVCCHESTLTLINWAETDEKWRLQLSALFIPMLLLLLITTTTTLLYTGEFYTCMMNMRETEGEGTNAQSLWIFYISTAYNHNKVFGQRRNLRRNQSHESNRIGQMPTEVSFVRRWTRWFGQ